MTIERKLDNKKGMASSFKNIGMIQAYQGNLKIALEYYQQEFELLNFLKDTLKMINCLNNIGFIYSDLDSTEKHWNPIIFRFD